MAKEKSKYVAKNSVAKATLGQVRVSPQKARIILEMIKGKQVEPALQILKFSPTKAASVTHKLLQSAIANAREHSSVDVDDLWVTAGYVNMGRTMKRFRPRAQGRATPIRKRASHITIELGTR